MQPNTHNGLSTLVDSDVASSLTLDMPASLQALFSNPQVQQPQQRMPHSYAAGGLVGPGGVPQRPPGQSPMPPSGGLPGTMGAGASGGDVAGIQQSLEQNPQVAQQIRAQIEADIAAGEITQQELQMLVNMAETAMQNPDMYPQMRQSAIRQGLFEEAELPQNYEEAKGLLAVLVSAGKSVTAQAQPGGAPSAAMQPAQASYEEGGALPTESKNPDGSIPIVAHEGEFMMPQEAVLFYGTDKLNKMVEKARNPEGNKSNGE